MFIHWVLHFDYKTDMNKEPKNIKVKMAVLYIALFAVAAVVTWLFIVSFDSVVVGLVIGIPIGIIFALTLLYLFIWIWCRISLRDEQLKSGDGLPSSGNADAENADNKLEPKPLDIAWMPYALACAAGLTMMYAVDNGGVLYGVKLIAVLIGIYFVGNVIGAICSRRWREANQRLVDKIEADKERKRQKRQAKPSPIWDSIKRGFFIGIGFAAANKILGNK